METLFKIALTRPAVEQSKKERYIKLIQNTSFQQALEQAMSTSSKRENTKTLARQYVTSNNFIDDLEKFVLYNKLKIFTNTLNQLEHSNTVDHSHLVTAITNDLGASPTNIIRTREFTTGISSIRDSILAIKLLPEEHNRPLEQLTQILRNLELIHYVANNPEFPTDIKEFQYYRKRSLMLPDLLELKSILSTHKENDENGNTNDNDRHSKQLNELVERFRNLTTAVNELASINGKDLKQAPSHGSSKSLPPAGLRPLALFSQNIALSSAFSLDNISHGKLRDKPVDDKSSEKNISTASTVLTNRALSTELVSGLRTTFNGRPAFRPELMTNIGFLLTDNARISLSKITRTTLEERSLNVTAQPIDEIIDMLRTEIRQISDEIDDFEGRSLQRSFKRIGNSMIMISTPIASQWASVAIAGSNNNDVFFPKLLPITDTRIPHSHGEIMPAGVADLIVIKQHLIKYESMDLAHIENVLLGERKIREHRRRRETEQLTFRETEITTSEERDLESTDRFEMTRETSETIREEASLKAGLTISGKYGPFIEFSASAEGSLSRSKEQATKTASTFSKDITQRSASKITERILKRESTRVTTEVEDKNEHTLDNVSGNTHVVGTYQWVEKVYEAQMFNYGLRTMYDFMVPEPGSFLIETLRRSHASMIEVEKPMTFTLKPSQITEYNYHFWVKEYGATNVEPPPEPYLTKSLDYSAGGGDDKTDYNHSAQVQIDDGYKAINAYVGVVVNIWDDDYSTDVVVGRRTHRFNEDNGWGWSASLDNERDSVPFALNTFKISDIGAVVEIKCQRTERALDKWRHDTHAKLTQAYQTKLSEYEEKLASLKAEAGIEIQGQSPSANLEMMKEELKKACISILTEQHYDLFDAIETGSNGLPQIDLHENEAEGPYVRFFEQAFEWEHMTWVTYPYFWGRKSEWSNRIAFEDADPLFNQFLKAGYCRVAVPVRENFEGAVDHFLTFGEPWMGGPLPTISSPLFLPIADELAEQLNRPGDEIPQGDPWEVRLPTNLVRLRNDSSLPSWTKDENGNWIAHN